MYQVLNLRFKGYNRPPSPLSEITENIYELHLISEFECPRDPDHIDQISLKTLKICHKYIHFEVSEQLELNPYIVSQ